ncbi:MAG: YHS domain-containing protein [Anaerolineae bacterium]|nr:YHS domain-containing protein [Anaerolineae bacterium]
MPNFSNLRHIIANLRPPILAELGLSPALHVLAEGTSGAQVQVEIFGAARRLSETRELVLFRSAQEAVWNAVRHGQAKHIRISVAYHPEDTHLTIEDDGCGFEPPQQMAVLSANGHFGLVGISERVEHLEGRLQLTSQPGTGTRIEIVLPVEETVQPGNVVRDPVCSAVILPQQAYASLLHEGERYYFCCPVCEGAFQTNPAIYLQGNV